MSLCKLIDIDQSKCLNCHTCITVCPVKYCLINDDRVRINHELCIGCGRCYKACPHGAINIVDDFDDFMKSINQGQKGVLIVSPSVLITFKDDYKKLITWLKESLVLSGVFDEGVGAELASICYMKDLKENGLIPVISSHCPSVVEYIRIFFPELLEYLAPVQSPAVIVAEIIRKVLKFDGTIAYLGSCISKRMEFIDPDTNKLIKYNITTNSLLKYIKERNIDLSKYNETDFDFIPAERGSVFCQPGGMINIAKRYYENPKMFHLEGTDIYSNYLADLSDNVKNNFKPLPLFFDALNCEGGCFNGPAGLNDVSKDEEVFLIEKREMESVKKYFNKFRAQKAFEKFLDTNKSLDLKRIYITEGAEPIYTLSDDKLKDVFQRLNKKEKNDFVNCRSCGFLTCRDFSTAVYYGLNNISNCRFYSKNFLAERSDNYHSILVHVSQLIDKMESFFSKIRDSFTTIEAKIESIQSVSKNIEKVEADLKQINDDLAPGLLAISEISDQINLLSLNASIEATKTGETGKGFSVVSIEIRKLADKTKLETDKIISLMKMFSNNIKGIVNNIDELSSNYTDFSGAITELHSTVDEVISINESMQDVAHQTKIKVKF